MDRELEVLTERVDRLIKLVATGLVADKTQRDQIWLLSKAGLPPREIAEIIGTSANTVRVELTAIRKRNKKRGRQHRKKKEKT